MIDLEPLFNASSKIQGGISENKLYELVSDCLIQTPQGQLYKAKGLLLGIKLQIF